MKKASQFWEASVRLGMTLPLTGTYYYKGQNGFVHRLSLPHSVRRRKCA